MRQKILPRPPDPWSLFAIAADRAIDETRIELACGLVIQPQPLDHAGAKVLNKHIGLGDQLAQRAHIALVFRSTAGLSLERLIAWKIVESPLSSSLR